MGWGGAILLIVLSKLMKVYKLVPSSLYETCLQGIMVVAYNMTCSSNGDLENPNMSKTGLKGPFKRSRRLRNKFVPKKKENKQTKTKLSKECWVRLNRSATLSTELEKVESLSNGRRIKFELDQTFAPLPDYFSFVLQMLGRVQTV